MAGEELGAQFAQAGLASSQMATAQVQRRTLQLEALKRFAGMAQSMDPNAVQTFNINAPTPASQPNPIPGAPVQEPRGVGPTVNALPPQAQQAYQQMTTPQQPGFAGEDEVPQDGMPAPQDPNLAARAQMFLGPQRLPQIPQTGGPNEPAPSPDGVPQLRVDQSKLEELRMAWRRNAASVPGGGALLDRELYDLGFDDREVRMLRGFGPLTPDLEEKIASLGGVNVRPYASGTDTPDQVAATDLEARRTRSGIRAVSGQVDSSLEGEPEDTQDEFYRYGQELRQDTRGAGGRGGSGGGTLYGDQIMQSLNEEMRSLSGLPNQLINARVKQLAEQQDIRRQVIARAQAGQTQEQINAWAKTRYPDKTQRAVNAWLFIRPGVTRGERRSDTAAGGGGAAPAGDVSLPPDLEAEAEAAAAGGPDTPVPGDGDDNLAPADAPEPVRKQWARIQKDVRAKVRKLREKGVAWKIILAQPDMQQAIQGAAKASGKR